MSDGFFAIRRRFMREHMRQSRGRMGVRPVTNHGAYRQAKSCLIAAILTLWFPPLSIALFISWWQLDKLARAPKVQKRADQPMNEHLVNRGIFGWTKVNPDGSVKRG